MHAPGRAAQRGDAGRAQGKGAAPSDRRRWRLRGAGRRRRAAGARAGSCAAFWRSIYNAAAPVQSRRPGSRRVLASTALAAEGHHVISGVGADTASAPARWHTWALRRGRAGAARGTTERPNPARWPGPSERAAGIPRPEGALSGAPGRAPPSGALLPRTAAAPRGPGSARTWGWASGPRRVLLLFSRQAQSRKHLHLPPLCLNAAPCRGPREGAPRLSPPGVPGNLRPGPHGLEARERSRSGV